MINIPNALTVFRIILIPVMVLVFYLPWQWSNLVAALIFAVAGITDWLDGYLARRLGQSTPFGAFLDPVADKLIVVCALALLIEQHSSVWFTIPAMIIIGREIVISALREWMAELGKRASVAVSMVGKVKTTMQIIAITVLLGCRPMLPPWAETVGYGLLFIAAVLTLWSMFIYLQAARREFKGG
jgi:CDP-diacylglycerol--glycerol-3-phosphate 3-phosphatidyltransferase